MSMLLHRSAGLNVEFCEEGKKINKPERGTGERYVRKKDTRTGREPRSGGKGLPKSMCKAAPH